MGGVSEMGMISLAMVAGLLLGVVAGFGIGVVCAYEWLVKRGRRPGGHDGR